MSTNQVSVRSSSGDTSFDVAVHQLESTFGNFSTRFIRDMSARRTYQRLISQVVNDLRIKVNSGVLSIEQAAALASRARNELLALVRSRSSDVGRTLALAIKPSGYSLDFLLEKYSVKTFGVKFSSLSQAVQREIVLFKVLTGAGNARTRINVIVNALGKAGGVLALATLGLVVYDVCQAKDKTIAAGASVSRLISGLEGAALGGWAGAVCGPGAFICVPLGLLIGGALASYGSDMLWVWLSR